MRRPRVTAAMRRSLAELRSAQSNPRRGGVMRVPRIATDLDAWEREASAHQDQLIKDSWEDRADRTPTVTTSEPDRQAEHQEAYRKYHEQTKLGGLDYVRQKEAQIKEQTRKERLVR